MHQKNYDSVKTLAIASGADLFGIANTARLHKYIHNEILEPARKLPFTVSVGIRLQPAVLNSLIDRPNQIYKTHYRQVNSALDSITHRLASHIQAQGYNALPVLASFIVDWQKQNAHISHRHAAIEAGLGHLGKNNLLIHPLYGAAIRLSSVLTDLPLVADSPVDNSCGNCSACMITCPADAITEQGFDFEKCYAQIKRFAKENNYNLHICGLCVSACADVHKRSQS